MQKEIVNRKMIYMVIYKKTCDTSLSVLPSLEFRFR